MTDGLLVRLERRSIRSGCARLATLIHYLRNDSHRPRMLAFIDDKADDVATFVIQGLGNQSYSTTSDQAIRNGLGKIWSPREWVKMDAMGRSGSPGLLAMAKPRRPGRRRVRGAGWRRDQRLLPNRLRAVCLGYRANVTHGLVRLPAFLVLRCVTRDCQE